MSEEKKVEKIFSLEIVKKDGLVIMHAEMEKARCKEMVEPVIAAIVKFALPPKMLPPPELVKEESKSEPKSPEI